MIYGSIVLCVIGPFHIFNFFYLIAGITLFLYTRFYKKLGEKLRKFLMAGLLILSLIFICTEGRILSFAMKGPESDADYVIVLGSQIREDGPSIDYRARLDSVYEYLMENKKTKVICTGGQGKYEPISEGRGGYEYLVSRGIDKERILIEEESTNTVENLTYAKEMIDEEDRIVIISADYHLYRASYIAEKTGLHHTSYKGGHGLLILLPQYYTREFFALYKEYMTLR